MRRSPGPIERRTADEAPAALVLGLSETGLSTMKLLRMTGVPCWGLDERTAATEPAFRSIYCRNVRAIPRHAPDTEVLQTVTSLGERLLRRGVLIPASDRFVRFVSSFRNTLAGLFRFFLPEDEAVEGCLNKAQFALFARSHGIPVPPTESFLASNGFSDIVTRLGLPMVIKPVQGACAALGKVAIVRDEKDCTRYEKLLSSVKGHMLAQRFVQGPDHCHIIVSVVLDGASQLVAIHTSHKVRQSDGAGVGTYVRTGHHREAERTVVSALQKMGFIGVAEVDLKIDTRSGELFILDVNPRLWSQVLLPARTGLNFARIVYDLARGVNVPPRAATPGTVAWQDIVDDFYASFRRNGYLKRTCRDFGSWFFETTRAKTHPYASLKDPGPLLVKAFTLFKQALTRPRSSSRRLAGKPAATHLFEKATS